MSNYLKVYGSDLGCPLKNPAHENNLKIERAILFAVAGRNVFMHWLRFQLKYIKYLNRGLIDLQEMIAKYAARHQNACSSLMNYIITDNGLRGQNLMYPTLLSEGVI